MAEPTAPAAPDTAPTPATPATAPATPAAPAGGDPNPTPATPAASDGGTPDGSDANPTPPAFEVPAAYKEKPWASKVKSAEDLWKQLDNSQALLGRKTVVPDLSKATPQELADFQAALRPPDEKAYDMSGGAKDYEPGALDPEFAKAFHKAGIPPAIGNGLIADLKSTLEKAQVESFDHEKLFGMLEKRFGNGYEVKAGQTRQLIEGNLSKGDNEALQEMPNQYLQLVYALADNMRKAYGVKETGLGGEHRVDSIVEPDIGEVRKTLRTQINDLSRKPHTAEDKQELVNKLNATYQTPTPKR